MADPLSIALRLVEGATAAATQPLVLQAQMLREDRLRKERTDREDALLTRQEERQDKTRAEDRDFALSRDKASRDFAREQSEIDADNRFAMAEMQIDAESKMREEDDARRQKYYEKVQDSTNLSAAKGYALTQKQLVDLETEMERTINQFPTENATIEKAQANALLNAGLLSDALQSRIFRQDGSVSSDQLRQAVAVLMSNGKTKAQAQEVMMRLEENLFSENSPIMLRNQQLAMRLKPILDRRAGLYSTKRRLLESAPGLSEYEDILQEDVMEQMTDLDKTDQVDDGFSLPDTGPVSSTPAEQQGYFGGATTTNYPSTNFPFSLQSSMPGGRLPTVPEGARFELGKLGADAKAIRQGSIFNSN